MHNPLDPGTSGAAPCRRRRRRRVVVPRGDSPGRRYPDGQRGVRGGGGRCRVGRRQPGACGLRAGLLALLPLRAGVPLRRGAAAGVQARRGVDEERRAAGAGIRILRHAARLRFARDRAGRIRAEHPSGTGAGRRPHLLRRRGRQPAPAAGDALSVFGHRASDAGRQHARLRRPAVERGIPRAVVAAGLRPRGLELRLAGDGALRHAAAAGRRRHGRIGPALVVGALGRACGRRGGARRRVRRAHRLCVCVAGRGGRRRRRQLRRHRPLRLYRARVDAGRPHPAEPERIA